jgi:hypothetical protein
MARSARQFGDCAVDVVEFGAGRQTEHPAVVLGHRLLREPQLGAGLEELRLGLEVALRALHLQERPVRGFDPEVERGALGGDGRRRLALGGAFAEAFAEPLGEAPGRRCPALQHHRLVLEGAAAERHPGPEHPGEAALVVPEVGEARALGHALQRFLHVVAGAEPDPRVDHPPQGGRHRRLRAGLGGAGGGVRALRGRLLRQPPRQRGREVARRGPELGQRLACLADLAGVEGEVRKGGQRRRQPEQPAGHCHAGQPRAGHPRGQAHGRRALAHGAQGLPLRIEKGLAAERPHLGKRLAVVETVHAGVSDRC